MKKSIFITISFILILPYLAYVGLQAIYPSDPDIVYVKQPNLFSGTWEKTASSDSFSEYIDRTKIEKNIDSTVDVVVMRNYYKLQKDLDSDKNLIFKSQVSNETIDCFNQTIIVNKMYFLGEHFAGGSLVDEPIEPLSTPIRVQERTIGLSKLKKVCSLANMGSDAQFIKSYFMNNI
jgi:hypothetical protein